MENSEVVKMIQDISSIPVGEVTYHKTRALMGIYFEELAKAEIAVDDCRFYEEEESIKSDFYKLWKPFIDVCLGLEKLKYSDNWEVRVAIKDAKRVLWVFPFGWKHSC